ncbi:MAG: hypothetical protein FWH48_03380, partial [Oscillospiraceae bacterium]|nr:hypothetical protein [Oscillospiraceae bacterium]
MNVSESNNFFRESFRGFNKDDVAEYIAKLSRDYTANEEKYKEHIARLTAELKAKNEETTNVGELASELNEKDAIISNLQAQLDLANLALKDEPGEKDAQAEQIEAYQQTIDALSKELDELRESESKNGIEELNQLSFQLAEAESEKLYLFGLLKKIILLLGLENAQIGDIEYAKNISDIAPKAVISEQIESALRGLGKAAQKYSEISVEAAELLERNTELEARLDELWAKIAELE